MSRRRHEIAVTAMMVSMTVNGRPLELPPAYTARGHMRRAWVEGFRCGQTAGVEGTPLSKYKRAGVKAAFAHGFEAGKSFRRDNSPIDESRDPRS